MGLCHCCFGTNIFIKYKLKNGDKPYCRLHYLFHIFSIPTILPRVYRRCIISYFNCNYFDGELKIPY